MGQRLEWEVHRTTVVVWLTALLFSAPGGSSGWRVLSCVRSARRRGWTD